MAYTREDICSVIGSAFEWMIAMEKQGKETKMLLDRIQAFNRVIETLRVSIDELPKESQDFQQAFIDSLQKEPPAINIVKKEGFTQPK